MAPLAKVIPRYSEAVTVFAHDDNAGRQHVPELIKNIKAFGSVRDVRIEGLP